MTEITLLRSDLGDGGWSLHGPCSGKLCGGPDECNARCLLKSGEAEWIGGEWNRPDGIDYSDATATLLEREDREY